MWKSSDMWGRDVPGSLMGPLGRCLDQMLREMQMAKTMPTRAQTGMTPSGIEIEAISVLENLATFCPCLENVGDTEFERNGLNGLVEEISRQHHILAAARLLLAAFS